MIAMTERKDISKQRLSDFLAARLRARGIDKSQAPRAGHDSTTITTNRPEEKTSTASQS